METVDCICLEDNALSVKGKLLKQGDPCTVSRRTFRKYEGRLLEAAPDQKGEDDPDDDPDGDEDLSGLSRDELRERLRERDLKVSGSKDELVARLEESE